MFSDDPSGLTALLASLTAIPVQVSSRADQSMHLCLSYGRGLASRNVIEILPTYSVVRTKKGTNLQPPSTSPTRVASEVVLARDTRASL